MSPHKVVDEIEYLTKNFDAKKILLLDDNATVSKKRMQEISKEIVSRNIKTKLGCLGTIQNYDKETMLQMYKAGFRWIHYGAESGNDEVLKANGKNINAKQIKKAIIETKKIGFRVRTSWIFDLPGTDKKALQDTAKLILETEPDEIRAHFLTFRAGTKIYSEKKEQLPSQYIHNSQPELNLSKCSKEEIMEAINKLTTELLKKNYLVIRDPRSWRDINKLRSQNPELKFISFCPAKYGLNWEDETITSNKNNINNGGRK